MAQTVAGAVLPVRPRPPHPGVSGGPAPSGRQPVSPQPKPEVLSLADHPGRPGGLSPAVAGAVSASWSDSTRRAYSGQWRQFVAWAGNAGVPWLPAAPADIAEYLTAPVGRGAGLATVRQAGSVLSPGLRPAVSKDRFCEPEFRGLRGYFLGATKWLGSEAFFC